MAEVPENWRVMSGGMISAESSEGIALLEQARETLTRIHPGLVDDFNSHMASELVSRDGHPLELIARWAHRSGRPAGSDILKPLHKVLSWARANLVVSPRELQIPTPQGFTIHVIEYIPKDVSKENIKAQTNRWGFIVYKTSDSDHTVSIAEGVEQNIDGSWQVLDIRNNEEEIMTLLRDKIQIHPQGVNLHVSSKDGGKDNPPDGGQPTDLAA